MIAKKAGLINVPWDGYLKYFRPSARFTEHKQRVFAAGLIKVTNTEILFRLENEESVVIVELVSSGVDDKTCCNFIWRVPLKHKTVTELTKRRQQSHKQTIAVLAQQTI